MFFSTFSKEEDRNEIYGITDIISMRIEIEQIKRSGLVPYVRNVKLTIVLRSIMQKRLDALNMLASTILKNVLSQRSIACGEKNPSNYRGQNGGTCPSLH